MIKKDTSQKLIYKAVKVLDGTNADILYHDYPDGSRMVVARYGIKKGGFTLPMASEMLIDINNYRKKLEEINIPMPKEDRSFLEHDPGIEKAVIVRMIAWAGEDMASIIKKKSQSADRLEIKKLIHGMCDILASVIQNRLEGWDVNVGFDPHCSNFTMDSNGKIWFVDLFPPRYRKDGQPIVEWPAPKTELGRQIGYFKHYDVRGIILCFLSQLSRVNPDLKYFFEESTLEYFKKILHEQEYKDFLEAFNNLPWIKFRKNLLNKLDKNPLLELKELIKNSIKSKIFDDVEYNIYNLREIATELAIIGAMNKEELESFFKESHFEDELSINKVNFLQNQLIFFLNKLYTK